MGRLFRTVYSLVQRGRPLSDMKAVCELQEANGLELGTNYHNDKSARLFMDCIASAMTENLSLKVKSSKYVAILADGSTDASITDQETVLVKFVEGGTGLPVTIQADLVALKSADAAGVHAGLKML